MRTVLTWVDRRQALPAQQILAGEPGGATELARNLLDGLVATDERELSGIWSTASGALGGFRSEAALAATDRPRLRSRPLRAFGGHHLHRRPGPPPGPGGTHGGRAHRGHPAGHLRPGRRQDPTGPDQPPVLLALDEVANIAPLPDLPSMVSEGGGQGLVTLACLQDLSQARHRWPGQADGFPSLFGTTVVLPGIGDVRTLEALSTLAGDEETGRPGPSRPGAPSTDRPLADLVAGGRPQYGESVSTQWRRRLPADVIARGTVGHALAFDHRNRPAWIPLAPSHAGEPWRTLRAGYTGPRRCTTPPSPVERHHQVTPRQLDRGEPHPGQQPSDRHSPFEWASAPGPPGPTGYHAERGPSHGRTDRDRC